MPLEIRRKEKESSQNVIRRFTKLVRQSGVLLEIRKRKFHQRPKSRTAKKKSALRKEKIKQEYKKFRK